MEKFFLSGIFACNELDIVDQQHIGFPVALVKFACGTAPDRFNQLVGKFIPLDVNNFHPWVCRADLVSDGIEKVRFPEPGIPVDKKGIVKTGRLACNRHGSRVSKFVRWSYNISIKCKFIVVAVFFRFFFFCVAFQFSGDTDPDLNLLAENLPECLFQNGTIIMKDSLAMQFIWHFQHCDPIVEIERDGFYPADPGGICDFRYFTFTVLADKVPDFSKRFHLIAVPHFYYFSRFDIV